MKHLIKFVAVFLACIFLAACSGMLSVRQDLKTAEGDYISVLEASLASFESGDLSPEQASVVSPMFGEVARSLDRAHEAVRVNDKNAARLAIAEARTALSTATEILNATEEGQ